MKAIQDGAAGAGQAIKQILLALVNNEPASPDLRDAVGGNLTAVLTALQDLSSCVLEHPTTLISLVADMQCYGDSSNNETAALLGSANQQLTNAGLAGNGVVNNCK